MENPETERQVTPLDHHRAEVATMREQGTLDKRLIDAVQFALDVLSVLDARVRALESAPPPAPTTAAKTTKASKAAAAADTAPEAPLWEAPTEEAAAPEQPNEQAAA